ncbi:MAG: glutamate 5-kinase [Caulobacteraceae bacterium]|nr:glutamate 5-kinase [Caulobacteraceae bacterium]
MTQAGEAIRGARLIVAKIGSALLVDPATGAVNRAWLADFAAEAARVRARGQGLAVVSSGAVALGRRRLGLAGRTLTLAEKQASAAAGQSLLMHAWEEALEPAGLTCAQVLLTLGDSEVRRRFLNARATLTTLLGLGVTPIVNENDTVATEEIRYGDNDRLAARVAQMAGADLLILLSDVDGLYTADPRVDPAARRLAHVPVLTAEIEAMAGGAGTSHGAGGMVTKLQAARIAVSAGAATVIALGRTAAPLLAVEDGGPATLIAAAGTPATAYKAWIAGALDPRGVVQVDDGAARALRQGASLLAAGVRSVAGTFGKGDAVTVRDLGGQEVARGLVRYDVSDARAIAGLRSADIEARLGAAAGPLIHADDLALTSAGSRDS